MQPQSKQPKVYISYSWADESIVKEIDEDWKKIGLTLIRDVRDIKYKGSIKDFMRSMATGDYVLVVISKSYLQSTNCMFEALELFKDSSFKNKILPIMAFGEKDDKIFSASGKIAYIKYWEEKAAKLDEEMRSLGVFSNIEGIFEERTHFANIRSNIAELSGVLSDMSSAVWPKIKHNNYDEIFKHIGFQPNESEILMECNRIIEIAEVEIQELELDKLVSEYGDNIFTYFTRASINDKDKKYRRSKEALEKVLEIDSNYWLANFNLAINLTDNIKDYEGAKRNYLDVIKKAPRYVMAYINLAKLLAEHFADCDEAHSCLFRALSVDPNNALVHYNIAVLLRDCFKDVEGAKHHFAKTVEIDSNYHQAYFNLGNLFFRNKNYTEAEEQYKKAIEIKPDYAKPNANLAIMLDKHLAKFYEARQYYERALELNPEDIETRNYYAFMLSRKLYDFPAAIAQYKVMLDIEPENSELHYSLAHILSNNSKDYSSAKNHYEIALRINPNYVEACYNLANLLMEKMHDYKAAEIQYKKVLEIDKDHFSAHHNLANLMSGPLVNYTEAESQYKIALSIDPNAHDANYGLANLMAKLGRYSEAKFYYEEALRIKPEYSEACHNLAIVFSHYRDYYKAVDYYEKAIRINPMKAFGSHFNLSQIFKYKLMDNSKAKEHYIKAGLLDPSFRTASSDKEFGI